MSARVFTVARGFSSTHEGAIVEADTETGLISDIHFNHSLSAEALEFTTLQEFKNAGFRLWLMNESDNPEAYILEIKTGVK